MPYVLAVPISYVTADDNTDASATPYYIHTESTTVIENATIAVHTILAQWKQSDATALAGDGDDDDDDGEDDYDDDGDGEGGISDHAKAGIGVGVGIGALLIGAILFLIIRRKRSGGSGPAGDEKWAAHEMDVVAARGSHIGSASGGSRARGAAAAFPARGSLASNSRGSVGRGSAIGGIGGLGVETSPRRDAEMLVLREQKEAIQKRIEALEAGRETGAR